jgi:hypothetical protein
MKNINPAIRVTQDVSFPFVVHASFEHRIHASFEHRTRVVSRDSDGSTAYEDRGQGSLCSPALFRR